MPLYSSVVLRGVVLAPFLFACAPPHRTFTAPPATLTPDQRVAAYHTLRSAEQRTEITTRCGGGGGCSQNERHWLVLGNREEVHHAEDLAPLVPVDSETAGHIRDAQRSRRTSNTAAWIGVGGLAVGLGFIVSGIRAASSDELFPPPGYSDDPLTYTRTKVGLALAVTSFIPLGVSYFARRSFNRSTRAAFSSYTPDLARRLAVCAQGFAIVACENATAAPGATTPVLAPGVWPGVAP